MVSRILISIALLCSSVAMSQSIDLSLSRVITIDTLYTETTSSGNWTKYSQNYEVPEGKVWKVEYIYPYETWIINDVEISLQITNNSFNGSSSVNTSLMSKEFWLDSGDKIKFKKIGSYSGSSIANIDMSYFLSILEFNTD